MNIITLIKPTPWDTAAFGIPTWELLEYSAAALQQATQTAGHHNLKVDPLADKRLLHEYGFYYCDTLIETYCNEAQLQAEQHPDVTISKEIDKEQVLAICHGAFTHGRFHRDFNLSKNSADLRYNKWLEQLIKAHHVYALHWQGILVGFIGYSENKLVLHALSEKYRGKRLAKFWWSEVCNDLFAVGYKEVQSSISVTNLAALNLYSSLNFSFREPRDIYHLLVT